MLRLLGGFYGSPDTLSLRSLKIQTTRQDLENAGITAPTSPLLIVRLAGQSAEMRFDVVESPRERRGVFCVHQIHGI